jgi:hypothetical protein
MGVLFSYFIGNEREKSKTLNTCFLMLEASVDNSKARAILSSIKLVIKGGISNSSFKFQSHGNCYMQSTKEITNVHGIG